MSPLGRSAILAVLYLACGALFAAGILRIVVHVVAFVREELSASGTVVSVSAAAAYCIVLALALRGLGALRARWGVDFRRPRVHRSTFDV